MAGLANFPTAGSLNFPLLFERIGNYLAKGPNASPEELEAARLAFYTIVDTIYLESVAACPEHPLRKNF